MITHFRTGADTNHFLSVGCAECTACTLSLRNMETVESWYHQGIIGQDAYEAYMHVWATSAHRYGSTGGWAKTPEIPAVVELVALMREALALRTAS